MLPVQFIGVPGIETCHMRQEIILPSPRMRLPSAELRLALSTTSEDVQQRVRAEGAAYGSRIAAPEGRGTLVLEFYR